MSKFFLSILSWIYSNRVFTHMTPPEQLLSRLQMIPMLPNPMINSQSCSFLICVSRFYMVSYSPFWRGGRAWLPKTLSLSLFLLLNYWFLLNWHIWILLISQTALLEKSRAQPWTSSLSMLTPYVNWFGPKPLNAISRLMTSEFVNSSKTHFQLPTWHFHLVTQSSWIYTSPSW